MAAWREILIEGTTIDVVAANMSSTSHFELPAGTSAQRPGSPVAGDARYNSDDNKLEYWNGGSWVQLGGGAVDEGSDYAWTGDHDFTTGTPSTDEVSFSTHILFDFAGQDTISTGALAPTRATGQILREGGGTGVDDLDSISNSSIPGTSPSGHMLVLKAALNNDITVKHGSGTDNVFLPGAADLVWGHEDFLHLFYETETDTWRVPNAPIFADIYSKIPTITQEAMTVEGVPVNSAGNGTDLTFQLPAAFSYDKHFEFPPGNAPYQAHALAQINNGTTGTVGAVNNARDGIWKLTTGVDPFDGIGFNFAVQAASQTSMSSSQPFVLELWLNFPTTLPTSYHAAFGVMDGNFVDAYGALGSCTDGIWFNLDSAQNSARWEGFTSSGGTQSSINTGISADTTWRRFKIVSDGGSNVEFYVDGTQVGSTITSNIPSASLIPVFWIATEDSAALVLHIDRLYAVWESTQV